MSAETYLQDTEPAVQYLFKGLDILDSKHPPSIMEYVDDTGHVRMSKQEADKIVHASIQSMNLEFSRAVIAGSILQVAFVGLKEFSNNISVSPLCEELGVKPGKFLSKYCIGRTRFYIPIGLLIYAGRIQYNHWEEGMPGNKVAKNIFRYLYFAYYNNPQFDLAYVLEKPYTRPVSHYIVRIELNWKTYNHYLSDMRGMLLGDENSSQSE